MQLDSKILNLRKKLELMTLTLNMSELNIILSDFNFRKIKSRKLEKLKN